MKGHQCAEPKPCSRCPPAASLLNTLCLGFSLASACVAAKGARGRAAALIRRAEMRHCAARLQSPWLRRPSAALAEPGRWNRPSLPVAARPSLQLARTSPHVPAVALAPAAAAVHVGASLPAVGAPAACNPAASQLARPQAARAGRATAYESAGVSLRLICSSQMQRAWSRRAVQTPVSETLRYGGGALLARDASSPSPRPGTGR
jgi:hypothetical protein